MEQTLALVAGHGLSLALFEGGQLCAAHDEDGRQGGRRGQAERLLPAIAALFSDLPPGRRRADRLIVGVGPGSYTGLRIGLAAAEALALAWSATLSGVRSTKLVAAAQRQQGMGERLLVLLASPRGQVWAEGFQEGGLDSLGAPVALYAGEARALAGRYPRLAGSALPGLGLAGPADGPAARAALYPMAADRVELLYVRPAESRPG